MITRTASATMIAVRVPAPTWLELGLSSCAQRLVASAWFRSRAVRAGR